MGSFFAVIFLSAIGYAIGGFKIINEGNIALVERLGRYHRTLKPGMNWIALGFDQIVWEDTTREQSFDIPKQVAISDDNVSLEVEACVYWKVLNLEKNYYEINDVVTAMRSSICTMLGTELSTRKLETILESREQINKSIVKGLAEVTEPWGVKVNRVDITKIVPPKDVLDSMEKERAAEIQKRADLLAAEATAEYMSRIARAIESKPHGREILHFFATQRYVDASFKISESSNSKIVFLDPKALSENLDQILGRDLFQGDVGIEQAAIPPASASVVPTPPQTTAPPSTVEDVLDIESDNLNGDAAAG